MARIFQFANLARSSLASGIDDTATILTVQVGAGHQFPAAGVGLQFALTLTDAATGLLKEVVYCTDRPGDGDTMTVIRGQEGYTPLNWSPGDPIANLWTSGQATAMVQQGQQQSQSQNYAVDTGSVNAYVGIYNPVITTPIAGMPLRLKIANTNTGASTYNPGSGIAAIVSGTGQALTGGELIAGLIYDFTWIGTAYEVVGPSALGTPPAMIAPYAGNTAPGGWLFCNGASLLRASFPALNAVLSAAGYPYGSADATHFNVPDLRGRVPAGLDGGTGRLTATSMTPDGNTLGASGGAQTHTGSIAGAAVTIAGGTVTGDVSTASTILSTTAQFGSTNVGSDGALQVVTPTNHTHDISLSGANALTITTGTVASAPGTINAGATTGSIVTVQPTLAVNYIIKT